MANPTYLRQIDTDRIYVWTKLLALRADMEPYEKPEVIPAEVLDELMAEEVTEEVPASAPVPYNPRKQLIKEAIAKILPGEYNRPTMGRPAMPKVKMVSDLVGCPVTATEILEAME